MHAVMHILQVGLRHDPSCNSALVRDDDRNKPLAVHVAEDIGELGRKEKAPGMRYIAVTRRKVDNSVSIKKYAAFHCAPRACPYLIIQHSEGSFTVYLASNKAKLVCHNPQRMQAVPEISRIEGQAFTAVDNFSV